MSHTHLNLVMLIWGLWLGAGFAAGGINLAPGFDARIIATGSRPTGQEYNPVTDSWFGIDTAGFDYITETKRDGSITVVADTFGNGGLSGDMMAVADTTNLV